MTNFVYDIFGSVFALLLTAESLLFVAVVDWICAAGLGAHQMSKLAVCYFWRGYSGR